MNLQFSYLNFILQKTRDPIKHRNIYDDILLIENLQQGSNVPILGMQKEDQFENSCSDFYFCAQSRGGFKAESSFKWK